jgi:hypothetical protein
VVSTTLLVSLPRTPCKNRRIKKQQSFLGESLKSRLRLRCSAIDSAMIILICS